MTAASASPEFITLGESIAGSQQDDHPYNCRMRAFRRYAPVRRRQTRPVVALSVTPLEGKDQSKTHASADALMVAKRWAKEEKPPDPKLVECYTAATDPLFFPRTVPTKLHGD